MSSAVSDCSCRTSERDSSGDTTENEGFSVVAADEQHDPVLHRGQQGVLLGLGEAVHLVDEQHRLLAREEAAAGQFDDAAHFLHPGGQRGQCLEAAAGGPRDQRRERGLAGAGRTVQEDGRGAPTPPRGVAAAHRGPADAAARPPRRACGDACARPAVRGGRPTPDREPIAGPPPRRAAPSRTGLPTRPRRHPNRKDRSQVRRYWNRTVRPSPAGPRVSRRTVPGSCRR